MDGPGLQRERTALAWQRTGVSGTLVGGVAVLAAMHRRGAGLVVVAILATIVCTLAAAVASTRPPRRTSVLLPSPWTRLVATAAIPVMLAGVGLALAIT